MLMLRHLEKFQSVRKIKFRPQFEIFRGFNVVGSRRGEELNKNRGTSRCTSHKWRR
jgi:hypothetical protein